MKNNVKIKKLSSVIINTCCVILLLSAIGMFIIIPRGWPVITYLIPCLILSCGVLIMWKFEIFDLYSSTIPQLKNMKVYTLLNYVAEKNCAVLMYCAGPDDMAKIDVFYDIKFDKTPEEYAEFLAIYNGGEKRFYLIEKIK